MRNIVLVGFMGTGKTVVAKALARDMGKTYVSTDDLIEAREKRAIGEIFRDNGEPYFREIEKEVIREVSGETDQVIDAGGGVVLDGENMKNLRETGIIICVWADPKTICERTQKCGHRPLLNVNDPEKRIKELLDYRRPFYEKSDFHVDTTDMEINAVVDLIKRMVSDSEKEKSR